MTDVQMAFVDMETTGLDANEDVPLELGIVLTTREGDHIAEWKVLVWEEGIRDFMHGFDRALNNEFVCQMHNDNDLFADLATFDTVTRDEAAEQAVEFLILHGVEEKIMPMAGSSTGSLDRPFTIRHFPKLNNFLSYRNIDISSIKELLKLNNPGLWEKIEPQLGSKEDAAHRVLEDCYAAIKEYQIYRDEFLIVEDK
jgi:oligoribonuclease